MRRWRVPLRTSTTWAPTAFAALLTIVPFLHPMRAAASAPSLEEVRAEAVRGGYRLINLAELRERLEREPGRLLLVDTRQDWEYRTGHIPGSTNFPMEPTWWSRLKNRFVIGKVLGRDLRRALVFY